MSSSEIFALRKQGRTTEALEMARAEYQEDTSDIWLLRAYAWSLYDHVKQLVDKYEAKHLSQPALNERMTSYMREFTRMGNPLRGNIAFSQMIRLAVNVSKDWRNFLVFARWAGINDFAEDDLKNFVTEQGKTIDSLKTRFTRAICRETVARASSSQTDQELISWGQEVLEQALEDAPNDQWLNYYRSKLHLVRGESERAIKRLAPVLHRQSRAAWTWALLGEILKSSRPDDTITCLAYATQLAGKEQEVAKVRIHLAQCLSLAGRFDEAAMQANLALQYREENGFKVPQELQQLLASDWYQKSLASQSMAELPNAKKAAQSLVQEMSRHNLTYTVGAIDHINAEKGLTYVATGVATGCGLPHRKFPEVRALVPGTLVEIGRASPDGPALDWRLSEATEISGLCQIFAGSLVRHEGKDFAFIRSSTSDVFVPPILAKEFAQGQTYNVFCLAIRRTNKQGKTGWRAVNVTTELPASSLQSDIEQ